MDSSLRRNNIGQDELNLAPIETGIPGLRLNLSVSSMKLLD